MAFFGFQRPFFRLVAHWWHTGRIVAVKVYHRTRHADAIMADGFQDATGTYLTTSRHTGVWVSADGPLDENEGAHGEGIIEADVSADVFEEYEWVEDGKPYREALIPAAILNQHPRRAVPEGEVDHPTFALRQLVGEAYVQGMTPERVEAIQAELRRLTGESG